MEEINFSFFSPECIEFIPLRVKESFREKLFDNILTTLENFLDIVITKVCRERFIIYIKCLK